MNYDKDSFLAGLALGKQMKGWSAYGVVTGWNPDGDLIIRPIVQRLGEIQFSDDYDFIINEIDDGSNEIFPEIEKYTIEQDMSRVLFELYDFKVNDLSERYETSEIIQAITLSASSNKLDYNNEYVLYYYSGYLYLKSSWSQASVEKEIDSGNLRALEVDTSIFSEITSQEIKET